MTTTEFLISDLDVTLIRPNFDNFGGVVKDYIEFFVTITCEGLSAQVAVQATRNSFPDDREDEFIIGYGIPGSEREQTTAVVELATNNPILIDLMKSKVSEALATKASQESVQAKTAKSAIAWIYAHKKDSIEKDQTWALFDLLSIADEGYLKTLENAFPIESKIFRLTKVANGIDVLGDLAKGR